MADCSLSPPLIQQHPLPQSLHSSSFSVFSPHSNTILSHAKRDAGGKRELPGVSSGKMLASARTVTQIRSLQLCFWPNSLDKPFFLLVLSTFCHSSKRPSQPLNLLICTLLTYLKPSLKPWFSSSLLNLSSRDSRLSTSYHYNDQRNLYWVWRRNKKKIFRYLNWYLFQWSTNSWKKETESWSFWNDPSLNTCMYKIWNGGQKGKKKHYFE